MIELPPPQMVQVADNYEALREPGDPYDTSLRGKTGTIETENTNDECLVRFDDGGSVWIKNHYLIEID